MEPWCTPYLISHKRHNVSKCKGLMAVVAANVCTAGYALLLIVLVVCLLFFVCFFTRTILA